MSWSNRIWSKVKDKELLKGGTTALLIRVMGILINYSLFFLIAHRMNAHGVGVFSLAVFGIAFISLLGSLGNGVCLVRYTADLRVKNELASLKRLRLELLELILPISLFSGGAIFILRGHITSVIAEFAPSEFTFVLISLSIPFATLNMVNVEVLRGLKRIGRSEFLRSPFSFLLPLFGLTILPKDSSTLAHVIELYCAGIILSSILSSLAVRSELSMVKPSSSVNLRSFLRDANPMMITAIMQTTNNRLPILILGVYCTVGDIGIFSIAFKIALLSEIVSSALKSIAMPKISELYWQDKHDDLRDLLSTSAKWVLVSTIPVFLAFIFFPHFVLAFFGDEFKNGALLLVILATGQFINSASGLVGAFMNMVGAQRTFAKFIVISTLANISLVLVLVPVYGTMGAAIAFLVSTCIWNIGGAIHIHREYRVSTFYSPSQLKLGQR